jgi:cytochrome c-type biogenesis protein CcmH
VRRLLVALAALALAPAALAGEERPTLAGLEKELVCPTCETTLDMSDAPAANRMRAFIRERIEAGDTKEEIKEQLVAQFGDRVLASPPRRGFNLLAWLLPFAGLLAGGTAVGVLARRWSRARDAERSSDGGGRLDPELERRLDEELDRFQD